jgi:hypothetical protein
MRIMIIASLLLVGGCTAEGNSYFLASGQTTRFISLAACKTEAQSKHADGSPRYAGFECRELLLDTWALNVVRYENGKALASAMPASTSREDPPASVTLGQSETMPPSQ